MAFKSHFWKYTYETGKVMSRMFGKDIRITIKIQDDDYPDLSWLGEWTPDKDGAIRVPRHMLPDYDRDVKYFKPGNSIKSNYLFHYNRGVSPLRSAIKAVQEARMDMESLHEFDKGDRYMVGVIAEIWYKGVKIATDSVWGCDVGIYIEGNQEFLEDAAFDCVYQAALEAQEYLQTLEANTASIDRLVKAYKRVREWRRG